METVHGPKLGSLVGELLQPLDLGKERLFLFNRCTSPTCCTCLEISFETAKDRGFWVGHTQWEKGLPDLVPYKGIRGHPSLENFQN